MRVGRAGGPTMKRGTAKRADDEGWPGGRTDHEEGRLRRMRWRGVGLKRRRVTW